MEKLYSIKQKEINFILVSIKDKNIGFDRYINNSILWIYWDILKNIVGYFDKKYQ